LYFMNWGTCWQLAYVEFQRRRLDSGGVPSFLVFESRESIIGFTHYQSAPTSEWTCQLCRGGRCHNNCSCCLQAVEGILFSAESHGERSSVRLICCWLLGICFRYSNKTDGRAGF